MKKHRKQIVNVYGKKWLVDVPVDGELYKADNREEYQRARSKAKHVSLDAILATDFMADVMEAFEKAELLTCLQKALQTLSGDERQLIECIYFDGLSEHETAVLLKMSRQNVNKKKHRIIKKLRNSLIDWL